MDYGKKSGFTSYVGSGAAQKLIGVIFYGRLHMDIALTLPLKFSRPPYHTHTGFHPVCGCQVALTDRMTDAMGAETKEKLTSGLPASQLNMACLHPNWKGPKLNTLIARRCVLFSPLLRMLNYVVN